MAELDAPARSSGSWIATLLVRMKPSAAVAIALRNRYRRSKVEDVHARGD